MRAIVTGELLRDRIFFVLQPVFRLPDDYEGPKARKFDLVHTFDTKRHPLPKSPPNMFPNNVQLPVQKFSVIFSASNSTAFVT